MAKILAVIFTLAISLVSAAKLRGMKFDTKRLARIGLVTALTIILYMIKLVPFPQGGGCSLLSVLPIMVLSVIAGVEEGLICAIVVGLTKIVIAPPYYPLQIPLDYMGAMMAIAFTPMFGTVCKKRLFAGALTASVMSMMFSVYSGVIFFGQFAPDGMNEWAYSLSYNALGFGVEALASCIVLTLMPLDKFKQIVNVRKVAA